RRSDIRAPQSPTPPSTAATRVIATRPARRTRVRLPTRRARYSTAEPDDVTPGVEPQRDGIERERNPSLALVRRHGMHHVAREQHHVAGLRRRADPLVGAE